MSDKNSVAKRKIPHELRQDWKLEEAREETYSEHDAGGNMQLSVLNWKSHLIDN